VDVFSEDVPIDDLRKQRMGSRNQNHGAVRPRKRSNDIFSRFDTIRKCDWRTDTGRRLVPRLRMASRGETRPYTNQLQKHNIVFINYLVGN